MRASVYADETAKLQTWSGTRRQGRPRKTWASVVHGHAVAASDGSENLEQALRSKAEWIAKVRRYCYDQQEECR